MKLNINSTSNQIAVFILLLGINIVISSLFAGFTAYPFFGKDDFNSPEILRYISSITQIGVFGLTALEFAFLVNDRKPMAYLELNFKTSALIYCLLILIIIVSLPAISYIIEWNEGIKLPQSMSSIETWMRTQEDHANEVTQLILSGDKIWILLVNLLVIGIIPAVCEEFLFRGIILTWFKNIFNNIHLSVFLSAVIFSAIHFQFYGFVPRFLLGLYFGYLFVWTGSLMPCIVAHFINNGMSVVVAYLSNNKIINTEYTDFGNVGDNYLLLIVSVIFTSIFLIWVNRVSRVSRGNRVNGDEYI